MILSIKVRQRGGKVGMAEKQELHQEILTGERALFQGRDLSIHDSVFMDGESPLKESENIELYGSLFRWKYPLWYSKHVYAKDCTWYNTARAGVWYTDHILVEDALIEAPKNFRRCQDLSLVRVTMSDAQETLWHCRDVKLDHVTASGDYFAMNCENLQVDHFTLAGNYSFDGVKNMEIRHARMLSRDAFWNSDHITVYDSYISGEYLGWNARNLTLVNCTVESLQGMCYIDNLIMKNCKMINTTLAFEYSSVDAEISGKIDSVMNPRSGTIRADAIDELIIEKDKVDPSEIRIYCSGE